MGSWIRLDLGTRQPICEVQIAWLSGNLRSSTFVVSVSNSTSGSTFKTVFSGKSSGSTEALETYDVKDSNARYVRITVNGNTMNTWASITEIEFLTLQEGLQTIKLASFPIRVQQPGQFTMSAQALVLSSGRAGNIEAIANQPLEVYLEFKHNPQDITVPSMTFMGADVFVAYSDSSGEWCGQPTQSAHEVSTDLWKEIQPLMEVDPRLFSLARNFVGFVPGLGQFIDLNEIGVTLLEIYGSEQDVSKPWMLENELDLQQFRMHISPIKSGSGAGDPVHDSVRTKYALKFTEPGEYKLRINAKPMYIVDLGLGLTGQSEPISIEFSIPVSVT